MASPQARVRSLMQRYQLAPNRRLGQHFLVDPGALAAVLGAFAPTPDERVVEIGPGTGLLTEGLLAAGATVLAVELDAGLVRLLQAELAHPALELVHGDCLAGKHQLHPAVVAWAQAGDWSLCANLPYDVSIPVLLEALALPRPPRRVVVTVQYEAAQRLCSQPGDPAWGASAAVAAMAGKGRIAHRLPPEAFHPRPRVASAVLVYEVHGRVPEGFGAWIRRLFAYRRKQVLRALRDCPCPAEVAASICVMAGVDPQTRVERLAVDELVALHQAWQCRHTVSPSQGAS